MMVQRRAATARPCGCELQGRDLDAASGATGFELLGSPLIFAPTMQGFGLNVVLRSGDHWRCVPLQVREREPRLGGMAWNAVAATVQWRSRSCPRPRMKSKRDRRVRRLRAELDSKRGDHRVRWLTFTLRQSS